VDDVHGINAILNDGDPDDDNGHGTHVAGIIGAVGDNGKGTVGVAWGVRLMACKFMNAYGEGSTSEAIECIDYARKNGATIINASWGGMDRSQGLERAIQRARDAGVILVTAAGNDSADNDTTASYPANFKLDNLLSVAATTRNDDLDAEYSNYGKRTVHLAAPGTRIYSTLNDSDRAYGYESGTSMAAPYVSGVLALVRGKYPDESYAQIIKRLLDGVDKVPSLNGKCISNGRVNLQRALGGATGSQIPPGTFVVLPNEEISGLGFPGGPFKSAQGSYKVSNEGAQILDWSARSSQSWISIIPSGGSLGPGQNTMVQVEVNDAIKSFGAGVYSATLTFRNAGNGSSALFTANITVIPVPKLEVANYVPTKGLQFNLSSPSGYVYVIEVSKDLQAWEPISTNTIPIEGKLTFSDGSGGGAQQRFYRSKLIPPEGDSPAPLR
jgi:hypothetical protein